MAQRVPPARYQQMRQAAAMLVAHPNPYNFSASDRTATQLALRECERADALLPPPGNLGLRGFKKWSDWELYRAAEFHAANCLAAAISGTPMPATDPPTVASPAAPTPPRRQTGAERLADLNAGLKQIFAKSKA